MKIDPALTLEVSASTTIWLAQGFAILLKFPWVPNYICGPIYSWIGQNSFFPFQSFGAYVADPKSSAKLQAKQTNSTLSLEQRLDVLKWAMCGLNYQAQFILLNQIQAVLGNPIQLGL